MNLSKPEYEKKKEADENAKACKEWIESQKMESATRITPNSNPATDPAGDCNNVNYWFHSGEVFETQTDWDYYDTEAKDNENKRRVQACNADLESAIAKGTKNRYQYGPHSSPYPCGHVIWLCNGEILSSEADYGTSDCAKPSGGGAGGAGGGGQQPDRCKNWKKPRHCTGFGARGKPECTCK